MTLLHEIGNCCVNPRLTVDDVLTKALDASVTISGATKGYIQLFDTKSGTLKVRARRGFTLPFPKFFDNVAIGEASTCSKALEDRQPWVVEDITNSKLFEGQRSCKILLKAGVRAVESRPLISSEGMVLGMISMHFRAPHRSPERVASVMDLLTRQMADYLERTRAIEALQQSEERYRTLFDLVPAAVYTCDAEGQILEFNRHAVSLWGGEPNRNDPAERYCGLLKIFYPDGRPMPHRDSPMARVLRGESVSVRDREIMVEREGGPRRVVAVSPTILRDSRRKIIGAINCLYDITERKRAEAELRDKKNELDLVVRKTPFMLTRCSRDLRFRYVSTEYARMLGSVPDALAGKSLAAVMGKKALATIRPYIDRVLAGQRVHYEARIPFKTGHRYLEATYLPDRSENGEIVGWIASLFDVTGRKEAEGLLVKAGQQQTALYQFVQRRHEAKRLPEIFSSALDAIVSVLRCDRASILLFDEQGVMRFVASRGISPGYRDES